MITFHAGNNDEFICICQKLSFDAQPSGTRAFKNRETAMEEWNTSQSTCDVRFLSGGAESVTVRAQNKQTQIKKQIKSDQTTPSPETIVEKDNKQSNNQIEKEKQSVHMKRSTTKINTRQTLKEVEVVNP